MSTTSLPALRPPRSNHLGPPVANSLTGGPPHRRFPGFRSARRARSGAANFRYVLDAGMMGLWTQPKRRSTLVRASLDGGGVSDGTRQAWRLDRDGRHERG